VIRAALACFALLAVIGCTSGTVVRPSPTPPPTPFVSVAMLNPAVTQDTIAQTICKSGWTKTIRPGHLPTKTGYRLDHIVPLELGGAPKNPANLRFVLTARSRRDDILEGQLHRQVCANTLYLFTAQEQIIAAKQGE